MRYVLQHTDRNDLPKSQALSIVFFCSFVPVFIIFLASVRTAVPVAMSSLFLSIILLLSGANYKLYPQKATQHAAGGLSFIVGILLVSLSQLLLQFLADIAIPSFPLQLVSALSVLLAEEGITIVGRSHFISLI